MRRITWETSRPAHDRNVAWAAPAQRWCLQLESVRQHGRGRNMIVAVHHAVDDTQLTLSWQGNARICKERANIPACCGRAFAVTFPDAVKSERLLPR
ncbi:hypothetical protein [Paraburkholderia podalyriae]|uniref:Uncharacterized protein n=1 Tax=Paraburkholderia podalyriae TaxID=1938811 RepID=A0ABR7Q2T9_9BURK|nr:hypothetical protein [Paraburkholderia podalyriae]MBC8752812.1 hypothetical protein [Paraburkholderia podalyriae]